MGDRGSVDPRVKQVLGEVMALQKALNEAIEKGDDDAVEHLLADLTVFERRRNRLVHRTVDEAPAYTTVRSLRDQVIQPLQLLSRPASLGLISELSKARWGEPIPTRRMASLRRDEQSSYESRPGSRPVYIAPALSADRFAAIRGTLTLSSWPLEIRIAGPASPRVDLLHSLVRLTEELDTGKAAKAVWAAALDRLVLRLARTVPTALAPTGGKPVDAMRVREACRAELDALEDDDVAVRAAAVGRARRQLSEEQQIFGVRMDVLTGEIAAGGRS